MSRNREGRALAAAETIVVGKKTYKLRPVVAQHLVDLEREALSHYRRQHLQMYRENADLLGEEATKFIAEEFRRVAGWDLGDLPQKDAFDTGNLPIPNNAKHWIEENYGEVPETDAGIRAVLNTALDQGKLTPTRVRELTGKAPVQGRIRYDQWWVTATTIGMISFIASAVRMEHPEVTPEMVASWSFNTIAEASRKVESITSASMGNG